MAPHLGFTRAERVPVTGSAIAMIGKTVATQVAAVSARFKAIYINNPAHHNVIQAIIELESMGKAAPEGQRAKALLITGDSATGKTSAMKRAAATIEAGRTDEAGPHSGGKVIYNQINFNATTMQLWTSILLQSGETFIEKRCTEEKLRLRAYARLQEIGASLVIFDEIQHLARSTKARDVTDVFKRILDDGIVPIVLAGTVDARRMIQRNLQIGNRMVAPCELNRLSAKNPEDVCLMQKFLARLDSEMVNSEVTQNLSGLDEPRLCRTIMDVSDGILGQAVNLVGEAVSCMVRRGGTQVEIYDLWYATQAWAIPLRIATYNAFVARGEA